MEGHHTRRGVCSPGVEFIPASRDVCLPGGCGGHAALGHGRRWSGARRVLFAAIRDAEGRAPGPAPEVQAKCGQSREVMCGG